jgi:hypothetical protein
MVSQSSGRVTLTNVEYRPAPSIRAASKMSRGMDDMAALNSTR